MKPSIEKWELSPELLSAAEQMDRRGCPQISGPHLVKSTGRMLCFVASVAIACFALAGNAQSLSNGKDSTGGSETRGVTRFTSDYAPPSEKTKLDNYLFDAYGPYPLVGAAAAAGINQWGNSPPEWGQGAQGYGKRIGSDFAIGAVETTTRYGLSEALKQDSMYYRCDCRGVLPRMTHAVVSTWTARRGPDGHRVFSFPALIAPYAGTFTAVYGWYPDRYGAKDAFRMGNYSLLAYAAGNISLEFFYSGTHSLLSRMHLNNTHGSTEPGPNH